MAADDLTRRKFIIDTDAGIDDAQAILMCLAASDVDVVALTTVKGNATAAQVTSNLLRLLKAADRLEIPIYRGCEDMLLGWEKPDEYNYHGKDGFGDVPDPDPPSRDRIQAKHAVQALIDITKQYPGEISLVALGPLTNISMAIRMDNQFGSRLKDCFIMGGNYKGEGNVTPSGEFNFYSDPEAAYIVLNSLGCPITLTCWELCLDCFFPWEVHEELRSFPSAKCELMKTLELAIVTECKKEDRKYEMADEMAMACALDNDVITKSHDVYATVELHGHMTRGQMVVDWRKVLARKPNVRLVVEMDKAMLKKMLLKAFED
ncbi:probable uridine nucleosidase 2 [Haliotis rufescens]|uniref:probable uridine nucleosidase 2 n=1 Tax=Haliotis rufescens TaxID=6454 RepID=UPI00201EF8AF|nr:probable uridine nucleosidase 2 [Haliotis rufescens]XP_048245513.1 probable uridine nucleosidase 2 [Haliotis rufescens]XP_048245514.1 probable uridine nucleosidase 2 [Haliotis rufescens]